MIQPKKYLKFLGQHSSSLDADVGVRDTQNKIRL